MAVILFCLVFLFGSAAAFKWAGVPLPYAKGMLLALLLCFLATICLAQNYTHNLIPGASDGIAPSNFVARWVFGEDGWTMQKFRSSFEFSTTLAVLFLLAYPVVVAIESKWAKK